MVPIASPDIHRIIDQLYGSLLENTLLHDAVAGLGCALGNRRTMLLRWAGGISDLPDIVSTCSASGVPFDHFLSDYGSYYHRLDPSKFEWPSVREGAWMHEDQASNARVWSRSEFHQDFALNQGVSAWSVLKVLEGRAEADQQAWAITFMREQDGAPLSREALRQIESEVGPHLRRALSMRNQLAHLRLMAEAGLAGLERCSFPIWIVDESGKVFFSNGAAAAYMRGAAPALAVRGGCLKPQGARIAGEWSELLALSQPLAKARAAGMSLYQKDGAKVVVQCLALSPIAAAAADWQRPMRMVVLNGRPGPNRSEDLLRHLYGLTPAEVRIGRLLLQDLTVAEIAQQCNTKVDTVRGQLKSMLRKTESRRQAELVRLLISLELFGGGA